MVQGDDEDYEPRVTSNNREEVYFQPYEVKTNLEEIKENCALC